MSSTHFPSPFSNKKKTEFLFPQGANKEIREAIADPSPEVQAKAWSAVLPLVIKLKRCYEHSLELDKIVPKLLGQLVGGKLNPTQHLETQQALVKQLAEILEFVLKFDEYKVSSSYKITEWLRLQLGQIWSYERRPQRVMVRRVGQARSKRVCLFVCQLCLALCGSNSRWMF